MSLYYFRVMSLLSVITFLLLVCKIKAPSPLPPRCDYLTRALGGKVGEQWSSQVPSWQQCATLCMRRPDCRYWTWHHQAFKCVTMRDATRLYFNPNAVSGSKHCQSSFIYDDIFQSRSKMHFSQDSLFGPMFHVEIHCWTAWARSSHQNHHPSHPLCHKLNLEVDFWYLSSINPCGQSFSAESQNIGNFCTY